MSESALVRRVNAGSYLYMKPSSRSGLNRVRALSQHDAQVTVSVEVTEQADHFEKERYWSPVVLTASNNKIDFVAESGGPELNAVVPEGTYSSPLLLAKAVRDALHDTDPASGNREYSVDWDEAAFRFVIAHHVDNDPSTAGYLDLLWNTGTNGAVGTDTHIGTVLGFDDAADDTGAGSYTGDNQVGTEVTWSAGPNLVVVAQGLKDYDLPDGSVLRFKADVGQVELTFYGSYDDPPYSQGPQQ